jgi:transposase
MKKAAGFRPPPRPRGLRLTRFRLMAKTRSLRETKIIMECTGSYYLPIANALHAAGLTVHTVNAILIHEYGNNSIRKRHNDKADARKIARYGITNAHTFTAPSFLDLPCGIKNRTNAAIP